ncbi:mitogen-activated protein kinase kinase kinase YODA-like [Magnolia sinica]|uniref:mitogen-activated protein kinase kinase kinase YODA-like n=1 Tax=Magnolia sinica TaxID=86752 RepID=UPI0026597D16|nr:mitogen-activated protein kinase kinase kinase YODA-like [Magnolia sinica]
MEGLAIHQLRGAGAKTHSSTSDSPMPRTCPVSPIGSPLLHPRSPQHMNGRMSTSPISSPRTTSGSSTPFITSSSPHSTMMALEARQGLRTVCTLMAPPITSPSPASSEQCSQVALMPSRN